MFKKELIIDGKGHLLGRLASVVAKEILNGQHVVCNLSIFAFFYISSIDCCEMRGYQYFRFSLQKQLEV